jgi:translation initiation factor IF-3
LYRRGGVRPQPSKDQQNFRINEQIRSKTIRLVGENISEPGLFSIPDALKLAAELELDLVEISPTADPPVCKIIDFQKFLYQQKKKQKEIKAKTTKVVVKEIRFGPNTDEHDYNFKLKHAQKFLEDGAKEKGDILLLRFAQDLEEEGKVESLPKLEGKRMTMLLSAKPKVAKKKKL